MPELTNDEKVKLAMAKAAANKNSVEHLTAPLGGYTPNFKSPNRPALRPAEVAAPEPEYNPSTGDVKIPWTGPVTGPTPEHYAKLVRQALPAEISDEEAAQFTFDPRMPVEVRSWDAGDGMGGVRRMHYVKGRLITLEMFRMLQEYGIAIPEAEWAAAREAIKSIKVPALSRSRSKKLPTTLFAPIADLQMGQGNGDMALGISARGAMTADIVARRLDDLRAQGVNVTQIAMCSVGDLVENLLGFYPGMLRQVQFNLSEQVLAATRAIRDMLIEVAQLGLPIIVPVVPGNHGQHRVSKGEIVGDHSDNFDILVMLLVQDMISVNPALAKRITFHFPAAGSQHLILNFHGVPVGFTHGHLLGYGSGHPVTKAQNFLNKQKGSGNEIGFAKVLFMGHYHHAIFAAMNGNRWLVQFPAMCDTNEPMDEAMALNGGPGITTVTLNEESVNHFQVSMLPVFRNGVAVMPYPLVEAV